MPEENEVKSESLTEDEMGETESYGLMSRIIGVFIEPSKAFKHIAEKPEIWGPMLFMFVILLVSSLLTMNKQVDLAVQTASEMMSEKGLPADTIDQATMVTIWTTRFQSLLQTIGVLLIWLVFSLIVFIVGLILGQEANYKSSLAVVGYSSLPGILIKSGFLSTILLMTRDWSSTAEFQEAVMRSSLGLYTFLGHMEINNNLKAVFATIDPFLIWGIILMAIGLKFANRTKMSNAWTTTIICNIVYIAAMIPLIAPVIKTLSGE